LGELFLEKERVVTLEEEVFLPGLESVPYKSMRCSLCKEVVTFARTFHLPSIAPWRVAFGEVLFMESIIINKNL